MFRERPGESLSLIVVLLFAAAIIFGMTSAAQQRSIGLTLEWESVGSDVEINYIRTEGRHDERKNYLTITKRSPAHYALMPGDMEGFPKWMEVEWQYGIVDGETYEEAHRFAKHAKAYIDLKALVPPEYIEEVARDRNRKQLKLTGTFNDDKLSVRADVYRWRD